MRDIRSIHTSKGGLVVLYGGDFHQTLSVVVGGGRKQTIEACLLRSYLFLLMQHFHLTTNMSLQSQLDFQQFLLDIGEGKTGSKIEILLGMVVHENSLNGFIDTIFDNMVDLCEHVILVVQNDDAQEINCKITDHISSNVHQYGTFNYFWTF